MREFSALSDRWTDGKDWLDYRAALVCTVVANMLRGPKAKAFKPTDFMPGKRHTRQSQKEMISRVKAINAAMGKKQE